LLLINVIDVHGIYQVPVNKLANLAYMCTIIVKMDDVRSKIIQLTCIFIAIGCYRLRIYTLLARCSLALILGNGCITYSLVDLYPVSITTFLASRTNCWEMKGTSFIHSFRPTDGYE